MAAESETSEIIRRRLFEWDSRGSIAGRADAYASGCYCNVREYADWVAEHKHLIPGWFQDNAREAFESAYPFHPMVLSVLNVNGRNYRDFSRQGAF